MPAMESAIEEMADQLKEEEIRERAQTIKYYGQVKELLNDNSRLVKIVTTSAHELEVRISTAEGEVEVKPTNSPSDFTKNGFDQIGIHLISRIRTLKEVYDASSIRIKSLSEEVDLLKTQIGETKAFMERQAEASLTEIKAKMEALEASRTEILNRLKSYQPLDSVCYLAIVRKAGLRFVYLKTEGDEEYPALTAHSSKAMKFNSQDDAHNFRARIIRAVKKGNLNWSGGLECAKKLSISRMEVSFHD